MVSTDVRRARVAVIDPHPGDDRFDPDFRVALKCQDCGALGFAPRKFIKEAVDDHRLHCPSRVTREDEVHATQIIYPKQ